MFGKNHSVCGLRNKLARVDIRRPVRNTCRGPDRRQKGSCQESWPERWKQSPLWSLSVFRTQGSIISLSTPVFMHVAVPLMAAFVFFTALSGSLFPPPLNLRELDFALPTGVWQSNANTALEAMA